MEENKIQLTMPELIEALATATAKAIKDAGIGEVERKHGVFPDPQNPEETFTGKDGLRKFLRGVIYPGSDQTVVQRATLVEGSGSGSYIVPTEYANFISTIIGEFGVARRKCRILTPKTKSLLIPDQTATVTVTVPGENTAFSQTQPTIAQKTLALKVIGGISPFSLELLEDNGVDLLDFYGRIFAEAIYLAEDDNVFGDATSLGTPLLSLSSGNSVSADAPSYTGFTADDLQKVRRAVNPKYWRGAEWFMHPFVFTYLEQLKDSVGRYIVRQPADSSQPFSMWGHPINLVDGMPYTDAVSTAFIGFANPKLCMLGITGDIMVKYSDQATLTTAGNLWEKNDAAIRVTERVGMVWTVEAASARLVTAAS